MIKKFSLGVLLLVFISAELKAIGPRSVTSGGTAVKWSSMPVTVHLETDLIVNRGTATKDVTTLVNNALDTWTSLTDSDVSITRGTLSTAVDDSNVCNYFYDASACPDTSKITDGTNPLVIDEDGGIVCKFFCNLGASARYTTLGFASIVSSDATTGAAVKGEAVFNASCLNGVEVIPDCTTRNLSFSDNDFTSFIVHEMGHFLGLDHSQVNLTEATDHDTSNDNLINTMFPTFIVGNGANFKIPKRDDKVGLAQLYPKSTFTSSTWNIDGTVYKADGTQLQCANVIARNISDPKVDAISALSGDFSPANTVNGTFHILGLTAGVSYTITVEPLGSGLTGASGFTPCRGTNGESSPPSFTSFTTSGSFSKSAGATLNLTCTIGGTCTEGPGGSGGSSGSGGTGGLGGCSLLPRTGP